MVTCVFFLGLLRMECPVVCADIDRLNDNYIFVRALDELFCSRQLQVLSCVLLWHARRVGESNLLETRHFNRRSNSDAQVAAEKSGQLDLAVWVVLLYSASTYFRD